MKGLAPGSIAALLSALAGQGVGAEQPVWQAVPVPGGVAALARAAELDPGIESWRVLFETSRRLHPTYGDPARAALRRGLVSAHWHAEAPRLARGPERADGVPDAPGFAGDAAGLADRTVFLPLPPSLWRKAVLGPKATDDRLVEALLGDREASVLYRGLAQLDEPTLRFLARRPDLVQWICRTRADVFSVFAGSLRIRDERAEVPGGKEAESLWEDVTGESPSRPDRFLKELLDRDDGRLAFFYHAASHLEPAARRFALGLTEADPEPRRKRFRALALAFRQGPAWWRPEGGAFARPLVDPAVVLSLVTVNEEGRPAPPAGQAFWEAAFAGEVPPSTDLERFRNDSPFDAAWLADRVGLAPTPEKRRERLTQLAFSQRVLGAVTPGELADAFLAVRGLARQPTLVLSLDRMEVRRPAVYADAVRRAERLGSPGDSRRAATALTQFQGALALVERARWTRTLEASEAESLVLSLAAAPPDEEGQGGGIARWIEERLLPVLTRAVDGDAPSVSAEHTVLGAMAGASAGERRRLLLVRERQGGNTLDAVLAFGGAVRRFAEDPDPERLARLRETTRGLDTSALSPEAQDLMARVEAASARRARALVEAADELLADTLGSLAYAPHVGPADGTALLGANVARRHDFAGKPWELPEEVVRPGVPWHVRGSLLGLDVALARLSLRRLTGDMPLRAPGIDPRTALGFARTVALRSPFALRDDEAAAIAAAIARGRERAAGCTYAGAAETLAREGGLPAWRAEGLRYTLLHEPPPAAAGFFTLQELLRLGRPDPVRGEAWGTPDLARGGSLRLRPPPSGSEDLVGQRPDDHLAERLSDPVLRVAVELHARRLPASLAPGVLSFFTQDLVQEAAPISPDDWLAIARFARDWPGERFDDYVAALSGDGRLAPMP